MSSQWMTFYCYTMYVYHTVGGGGGFAGVGGACVRARVRACVCVCVVCLLACLRGPRSVVHHCHGPASHTVGVLSDISDVWLHTWAVCPGATYPVKEWVEISKCHAYQTNSCRHARPSAVVRTWAHTDLSWSCTESWRCYQCGLAKSWRLERGPGSRRLQQSTVYVHSSD